MNKFLILAISLSLTVHICSAKQNEAPETLNTVIEQITNNAAAGDYTSAVDAMSRLILAGDGKEWTEADGTPLSAEQTYEVISTAFGELVNELWSQQTPEADALVKDLVSAQLTRNPADTGALQILGTLALGEGDPTKALGYFNKALEYDPNYFPALLSAARAYFSEENDEKAEELFKKCLDYPEATGEVRDYILRALDFIENHTNEITDYDFEFLFLPQTTATLPVGDESIALLNNPDYFVGTYMAGHGWRLRNEFGTIMAEKFGSGTDICVVWTMPMPQELPLARYIAFVPDKSTNNYMVYYVEKSLPFGGSDTWVVGHKTANAQHLNYGDINLPETPGDFLKIVESIIKSE